MKGSTITQIDRESFLVPSQSKNSTNYKVENLEGIWVCECPDFQWRAGKIEVCKHIIAVQLWLKVKSQVENERTEIKIPKEEVYECKFCKSPNVVKYGKKGRKQAYNCKDCHRTFVAEDLFRKLKFDPQVITSTLDLYFKGVSLRKISDHLYQQYGLTVNFSTIQRWMGKYVRLMSEYASTLRPELSGIFHADEMKVKVAGQWRWLWSVMDRDTRLMLASQVTEKREIEDARRLFAEAKAMAKIKPDKVITDGLHAYKQAFNKEFFTLKNPRTEHVSHIRLSGDMNNNIMERLNGTRRERDKVLRGMKKEDSPIREGFDVYYDFVRPHQALNGKTPAEASNIGVEGQNKLLSLIKRSLEHNHTKCNTPTTTN
jgi:putative transposase